MTHEEIAKKIVTTFWGTGLELEGAIENHLKAAAKEGRAEGLREAAATFRGKGLTYEYGFKLAHRIADDIEAMLEE